MSRVMIVGYPSALLVPLVERAGYEVASVPDERGMVELAERWAPDLIVVEVASSGGEAQLSATPVRSLHVPFVVIAPGYDDGRRRAAALDAGADDCVSEPLDPRELVARVRAILRRRLGTSAGTDAQPADQVAVQLDILPARDSPKSVSERSPLHQTPVGARCRSLGALAALVKRLRSLG